MSWEVLSFGLLTGFIFPALMAVLLLDFHTVYGFKMNTGTLVLCKQQPHTVKKEANAEVPEPTVA